MRFRLFLLRVLALFALAVSAALLADQVSGAGAFCSFGRECEEVAASVYGKPGGVPLPALGIAGFALIFVLTLVPNRRAAALVRPLAAVAGAGGAALIVIQVSVLHRLCPLCLMVDSAALGLAVVAVFGRPEITPPGRVGLLVWLLVGALAAVVPVCWSAFQLPEPVPDEVKAHWVPGKVTLVDMTDFECPHCQRAEAILNDVRARHDIHFVRVVVPMDKHENAKPAGRAYLAAVRQGKGEEMAAALYMAESRTPENCRKLAAKLGLNMAEYDKAVDGQEITGELYANILWARRLGEGLPMLWVQDRLFPGVPAVDVLEDAIRKAKPPEK
jgi:uncharacterized membrane protein/predicted DsbA family dithiol-disulfide isomerase